MFHDCFKISNGQKTWRIKPRRTKYIELCCRDYLHCRRCYYAQFVAKVRTSTDLLHTVWPERKNYVSSSVPDLAKFYHFGNISKVFGFFGACILGKILNQLGLIFYTIGQILNNLCNHLVTLVSAYTTGVFYSIRRLENRKQVLLAFSLLLIDSISEAFVEMLWGCVVTLWFC